MELNQTRPSQDEFKPKYFVRQRAFFDGYLNEIVDGHTGNIKAVYLSYDLAHKDCEKLNA